MAVEWVLLRLEHLLQVEWRRVLRLSAPSVHTRIHTTVTGLSKVCAYGLNTSLEVGGKAQKCHYYTSYIQGGVRVCGL